MARPPRVDERHACAAPPQLERSPPAERAGADDDDRRRRGHLNHSAGRTLPPACYRFRLCGRPPLNLVSQRARAVDGAEHVEDAGVWTATSRLVVSSYTYRPTRLSMLPSKTSPTSSPARLTIGDPELPPMMSLVVTKLSGVERSSVAAPSTNRCEIERRLAVEAGARSKSPQNVVSAAPRAVHRIAR